ncbi:MAG: type III pantothenate kinase [Desulfarculales bacterium]|jgi:type III pantothenate kinase|nr:type III pantothenate kinase [Desulfarculales bacterium]
MLLAVDVGNTNMVLGIFEGSNLLMHWRLSTDHGRTCDEMGIITESLFAQLQMAPHNFNGVIIASVVPPMHRSLEQWSRIYLRQDPLWVTKGVKTGMPVRYDNPLEVGADRIVNAVAAYNAYRQRLIVVDFGTATTFDVVSDKGEYLGGAITPGIIISCEALFQKASRLPRVEIDGQPKRAIATNTMDSMHAGIIYGYAGMVDGLVRVIQNELGGGAKVVATGGIAPAISPHTSSIDEVDDLLTLKGLYFIYHLNR